MQTQAKPSGRAPCSLNVLRHFILWLAVAAQLWTQECREVRADFCSMSTSEHHVERRKSSLTGDSHLIVCFRAQGRYFLFANPFKVEQICKTEHRWQQNSSLDANHPLRQVVLFHLWQVALNLLFFNIVCFVDTLQIYKKYQKGKITVERIKVIKM